MSCDKKTVQCSCRSKCNGTPWKGQECLTKVAKLGPFPCTILYKSCLFYPSWQATSFETPPSWVAFVERFHCSKLYCEESIQKYLTNQNTILIAVRGQQRSPWAHRAGGPSVITPSRPRYLLLAHRGQCHYQPNGSFSCPSHFQPSESRQQTLSACYPRPHHWSASRWEYPSTLDSSCDEHPTVPATDTRGSRHSRGSGHSGNKLHTWCETTTRWHHHQRRTQASTIPVWQG